MLLPGGRELPSSTTSAAAKPAATSPLRIGTCSEQVRAARRRGPAARPAPARRADRSRPGGLRSRPRPAPRRPRRRRCALGRRPAATLSPAKRTTSPQSTGWSWSISPKALYGTSAAVRTATTPGCGQRRARVDRQDARVRPPGEDDLQVQHARPNEVAGIARRRRSPCRAHRGAAASCADDARGVAAVERRRSSPRSGAQHGVEDLAVAGAAADVAAERRSGSAVKSGRRPLVQELRAGHQHAGDAVAALHRAAVDERLLSGCRPSRAPFPSRRRQPLDRRHRRRCAPGAPARGRTSPPDRRARRCRRRTRLRRSPPSCR